MPKIERFELKLKFRMVYRCSHCGKEAPGTTQHLHLFGSGTHSIIEQLENIPLRPQNMPVGWSHGASYHCGCKKKEA